MLIRMAQTRQLAEKVDENKLKSMLASITETKKKTITIQRKKRPEDEEEEEEYDL